MRILLASLAISLPLLTACQKAQAITNDELVQCVGVSNFGRGYWVSQSPPNYKGAISLMPAILYYRQKLRARGMPDGGEAAADAFVRSHLNDPKLLTEKLQSCGKATLADPEFVQQFDSLAQSALQADPLCRQDMSRCVKH